MPGRADRPGPYRRGALEVQPGPPAGRAGRRGPQARRGARSGRRCCASSRLFADAGRPRDSKQRHRGAVGRLHLLTRLRSAKVDRANALVLVELRACGARSFVYLRKRRRRAPSRLATGGAQRELRAREGRGVSRNAVPGDLPSRVRSVRAGAEERNGREGARSRQGAPRSRHDGTHDVFPADRARVLDDRADRDRVERNAGLFHRRAT